MKTLQEILSHQLQDLYSAELQLVEALPVVIKNIGDKELKKGMTEHFGQTKNHVERLEKIFTLLEEKKEGATCQAMKGLITESSGIMSDEYDAPALMDTMIVAIAQKIEHYEIAGYGNAKCLAEYLGLADVALLLNDTLKEEKVADEILTEVTIESILPDYEEFLGEESSNETLNKPNQLR